MDERSLQFLSVALGALWCALGAWAFLRAAARSPQLRGLLGRFRRARPAAKGAVAAGVVALVAAGGTKPGGGGSPQGGGGALRSAPPAAAETLPFAPVAVATNGVALRAPGPDAVFDGSWPLHGSSDGGFWIEADAPFFRVGTNPVSRAYVSAGGTVSFGSMRRPAVGAPLPDGSLPPVLAPLRAALGMVPDAAEPDPNARSRFWHEATPGGGRRLAWENARLGRLPGRRVSYQVDLEPDGGFVFRYDFRDALDPPAADVAIGAQAGTNAVAALALLGTNAPAGASVRRVDGAPRPAPVPVADLLCTNGVLRAPARFEIEWKDVSAFPDPLADTDGDGLADGDELFVHGTDPACADTDGDGLSDGAETLAGADPLDPDEDRDGIPDGSTPAEWAANPLWATNSPAGANVAVTLAEDVAEGSAVLCVGTLAIPLSTARTWELRIPEGPATPFSLRTTRGAAVALVLSPPDPASPDPIRLVDPDGVFSVEVPDPAPPLRGGTGGAAPPPPPRRKVRGGDGRIYVFAARFVYAGTGEPAPADECIHDAAGLRAYRIQVSDLADEGAEPAWSAPALDDDGLYRLWVSSEPGDTQTASAVFARPFLAWGEEPLSVTIHRCTGGAGLEYCPACDLYHDAEHPCPHLPGCPKRTDPAASCDCGDLVLRVEAGDAFAGLPATHRCCCEDDAGPAFLRLVEVPSFFCVSNAAGRLYAGDVVSNGASVVAVAEGGPGLLVWQTVHPRPDGAGGFTNAATRTQGFTAWGIDIEAQPIAPAPALGGAVENPCCVATGSNAVFSISLWPASFPDSNIAWTADGPGQVLFPGGNTGRTVAVRGGAATGDALLRARIAGYRGPDPRVPSRVVAPVEIPVHVFVVCAGDGTPARERPSVEGLFPLANEIYRQAGMSFRLASFQAVTNDAWTSLPYQSTSDSDYAALFASGSAPDGIELYCVRCLGSARGVTIAGQGVAIDRNATGQTLAHEFGHACGLHDVYVTHTNAAPGLVVTGGVRRAWAPGDWPAGDSEENYYPAGVDQPTLVRRLLMFGLEGNTRADLPAGDVRALWNNGHGSLLFGWVDDYQISTAPTSFHDHATRNPETH